MKNALGASRACAGAEFAPAGGSGVYSPGPVHFPQIVAEPKLRRTPSRNCLKSPGGTRNAGTQGTQTVPFGPFWPRYTGQIHARSVTRTPFQTVSRRSSQNSPSETVWKSGIGPEWGSESGQEEWKESPFGCILSPQRRAPDALGYFPNSFSTHSGECSAPRRLVSPRVRSVKLGGQRFHTCPSSLVQERHDLLLDDVLEVRRPPVGLEGVLARVTLVEQERPGIVDLLVDREFEAARLGTAGLRVLPQQSCHRRVVPLAHHISCDDD